MKDLILHLLIGTMLVNPYVYAGPTGSYSYSNFQGQGDRTSGGALISVSGNPLTPSAGPITNAVNGSTANNSTTGGFGFPLGATLRVMEFDFINPADFEEFTIIWSSSASQGTWTLESSPDHSSWVTRKSSFALGGSTNEVETLDTNLGTMHRYYRLRQISGATIGNRFLEITFKTWA